MFATPLLRLLPSAIPVLAIICCINAHCFAIDTRAVDTPPTPKHEAIPRYQLSPGQVLAYKSQSLFTFADSDQTQGAHSITKIAIVRTNPKGGWDILVKQSTKLFQARGSDRFEQSEQHHYLPAHLLADGQMSYHYIVGSSIFARELLPLLPRSETDIKNGWSTEDRPRLATHYYKRTQVDGSIWTITDTTKSPLNDCFGNLSTYEFKFDTQRGLPISIKSNNVRSWGIRGSGTTTVTLETVETHDPADLLSTYIEATHYLQVIQHYAQQRVLAVANPERLQEIFSEAEGQLKSLRDRVKDVNLLQLLEQHIAGHSQQVAQAQQVASLLTAQRGQPSKGWDRKGYDGQQYSTEGLKGNIAVLHFWNRGAYFNLLAIPTMNTLHSIFKYKGVQFLGLTTNVDANDGNKVIKSFDVSYPTIEGAGLPDYYRVGNYPLIVILDRQGKIHDMMMFYSDSLKDDLHRLLKEMVLAK